MQSHLPDYSSLVRASRSLDTSLLKAKFRLALLSDAATQQLVPLLKVLFHRIGFDAEIYQGAFGAFQLETLNPDSGLHRFQPDAVALLHSTQALRADFFSRSGGNTAAFLQSRLAEILANWDALQSRGSATILQSTFVMPFERAFGNYDVQTEASLTAVCHSLNASVAARAGARPGVLINDVEAVASWHGRRNWFDDRLWDMAKTFCSPELLPAVAKNIVDIAASTRGRVVKCVVLDLDNTLWGGVIGDDGLDGISLSAHGDGEAFHRFQSFLKELSRRGIILAVASKNEMNAALLPFLKHPDMVLRREDIAVFKADWNDKASNIRAIRDVLNIGLDSMVFLDDNPFERDLVRGVLPEVIVPDLPEDPAGYVQAVCELNLFETSSFSAEDLRRAELYRTEALRRDEQGSFASADDFLRSLDMRLEVRRFDPFQLPRIAQLIQRSNQFNLTTRRHSEARCLEMMNDPGLIPVYARLSDRLGDHGLIGIVVLEALENTLYIGDWLMSCRVLARGVEQLLMNMTFAHAARLGLSSVSGEYIPTPKNEMVRNFFAQFGFSKVSEDEGRAEWVLDVSLFRPVPVFITLVEEPATDVVQNGAAELIGAGEAKA